MVESPARRLGVFSGATVSVANILLEHAKQNEFRECQQILLPSTRPRQGSSGGGASTSTIGPGEGAGDPFLLDCKPGRRSFYFVHHIAFWGSADMIDWLQQSYPFGSNVWWAQLDASGRLPHEVAIARCHDVEFIERLLDLERRTFAAAFSMQGTTPDDQVALSCAPLLFDLGSGYEAAGFVEVVRDLQIREALRHEGIVPVLGRRPTEADRSRFRQSRERPALIEGRASRRQHPEAMRAALALQQAKEKIRTQALCAEIRQQKISASTLANASVLFSELPYFERLTSIHDCTMGVRVSDFAGQTQYYTFHSLVRKSNANPSLLCVVVVGRPLRV